jgi:hypothetical protein
MQRCSQLFYLDGTSQGKVSIEPSSGSSILTSAAISLSFSNGDDNIEL